MESKEALAPILDRLYERVMAAVRVARLAADAALLDPELSETGIVQMLEFAAAEETTRLGERSVRAAFKSANADEIDEQIRWIENCGGTLEGYVKRYGSARDPGHYGVGGEAIFAADQSYLAKLEGRATMK